MDDFNPALSSSLCRFQRRSSTDSGLSCSVTVFFDLAKGCSYKSGSLPFCFLCTAGHHLIVGRVLVVARWGSFEFADALKVRPQKCGLHADAPKRSHVGVLPEDL